MVSNIGYRVQPIWPISSLNNNKKREQNKKEENKKETSEKKHFDVKA